MKKTLFSLCVMFLLTISSAQSQAVSPPSAHPMLSSETGKPKDQLGVRFAASYSHLPMSFEANEGQTDPEVQFLSRTPGYSLFLQPDAATLSFSRSVVKTTVNSRETRSLPDQNSFIRMRLLGVSATAKGYGDDLLPGETSYLLGKDPAHWQTGLANYRRVKYTQVYPGIDLVYYGTNGQLEYDFELSPGADPSRIRMHFDGVAPLIDAAGNVNFELAGSSIELHRPVLYQQVEGRRAPVDGNFALNHDGDLVFVTGAYDHGIPLVIDPLLQFSSYLGGVTASNATINRVAVDSTGAIYVTGTTAQLDFPVTVGAAIMTCPTYATGSKCTNNLGTAFVTKIAPDGQSLVYSTYMGGSGTNQSSEQGQAIAVNAAGEAWVAGITRSPSFPITSDAIEPYCNPQSPNPFEGQTGIQSTCGDSQFIVKLNATGSAISYGTFFGGTQGTFVNAIALDSGGNVYFTGTDSGGTFAAPGPYTRSGIYVLDSAGNYLYPTTTSALQQTGPEFEFGYLTKLSADGHSLLYSTIFASPSTTAAGQTFSLALAVNGTRATIGGYTNSSSLPVTAGAIQGSCTANANNCVIFVPWLASFDTSKSGNASLVFSTYLEGPSQVASSGDTDLVSALATDAGGNIYVGGYTQQPNFPTTNGAFQTTCKAIDQGFGPLCNTGFVTKLTPAGAITWSTFFGSPTGGGETGAIALALDSSDNVYIADGNAVSDIPTNGSLMAAANGSAYVAELSSDGTTEPFGTFYGNGGVINVSAVAVNASNDIFLVGSTTGTIPLLNAYQSVNSNGGGSEGFFAKFSHLSASTTTLTVSPASTTTNQDVTFTATVVGTTQTTPTPTGTVTLTNTSVTPNTTLGTITLGANGSGTFSTKQLAVGTYAVSATYSSDTVYAANTLARPVSVTITTPAVATISLTVPSSAKLGTAVSFSATVSGTTGTPTGTIYFFDGATMLGSGVLAGGTATYSTNSLTAGTHSITANYSGDRVFGSATSTASTINITTTTTPVIALTVPSTATLNTAVTLGVTLTGTGGTPTGTVSFLDGPTTLGSGTLAAGKASFSTSTLTAGTHSITASYSGDTNFNPVVSAAQIITIALIKPKVSLTVAPATETVGASVSLGVTVSGTPGTPTGTVTFLDGTTVLNAATLVLGSASYSTTTLTAGTHTITASYSGDSSFAPTTTAAQTVTITAVPPGVSLSANPPTLTIQSGSRSMLVLTITPLGGFTGGVSFACSKLPPEASCSFSPQNVTVTSSVMTSTLTITTNSAQARLESVPSRGPKRTIPEMAVAICLLLPLCIRRRRLLQKAKLSLLLPLMSLAAVLASGALTGCSGSSTPAVTSTPAGDYSISVNATTAAGVTSTVLQVTVQ